MITDTSIISGNVLFIPTGVIHRDEWILGVYRYSPLLWSFNIIRIKISKDAVPFIRLAQHL